MHNSSIFDSLGTIGVVPVVVIEDADAAQPLGQALLNGGLPCAEVTFRTAAAESTLHTMTSHFPNMLVGAGTILSVEQAEVAADAGAKFIVTPGFDAAVVDWCIAHSMPIIPGVMTPTEINMALGKGLKLLKFFPAEAAGGVKMLKAISEPYREVRFIPTGGINPSNVAEYLCLPTVHACGGSWMVSRQLIAERQFERISQLAEEAVSIVQHACKESV